MSDIPANQDAFPCSNSSLPDISCKSGCISPPQNHPCQGIPANQDASPSEKSSPPKHSCKSGCIPPPQNHPCQGIPANQDASPAGKSSPPKHSRQSRCILSTKSISGREFCRIEMLLLKRESLADAFDKSVFSDFVSSRYNHGIKNPYINILPHKMPMYGYFCCFNPLRCQPASQAIVMESGQQCRLLRHDASASYFLQCIAKNTCCFPAEFLKLQVEPASNFICGNRAGIRENRMLPRSR